MLEVSLILPFLHKGILSLSYLGVLPEWAVWGSAKGSRRSGRKQHPESVTEVGVSLFYLE